MTDVNAPAKKRGCGFWILIALAILIGLGILGAIFGPSEAELKEIQAKQAVQEAATEKQKAVDREASAVKVTASKLFSDYEANQIAAEQTYGGKPLLVSGKITEIDEQFGDAVVKLDTSNPFMSVGAHMLDNASAATLAKGQNITVSCEKMDEAGGFLFLRSCILQ